VKFINALERDKIFFVIGGVTLGEQQGNVRLQLKLETYLRSGATT
jgi:type IV pilus assembly protein PilO